MHLHRERIGVSGGPLSPLSDVVSVTLSRDDVEAIDLALRVVLAAASPDECFLDLTRARAKLAGLEGHHHALLLVNRAKANRTVSPEQAHNESS